MDFLRKTAHMLEDAEQVNHDQFLRVSLDQSKVLEDMLDKFGELPDASDLMHLSEAGKVEHALRHWLKYEGRMEDADAVNAFAQAMREKMARSHLKGRSGWDDPKQCTYAYLRVLLQSAVDNGDMVDVANYAMMLWHRETLGV